MEIKPAFVTIKDHKPEFPRRVKCRLINPTKTHVAKISKKLLDNINNEIRSKTTLKQWKNTQELLKWYKKIENKNNKIFIKFDRHGDYSPKSNLAEKKRSLANLQTEKRSLAKFGE